MIFWETIITTKVRSGISISQSKGWKVIVGVRERSKGPTLVSGITAPEREGNWEAREDTPSRICPISAISSTMLAEVTFSCPNFCASPTRSWAARPEMKVRGFRITL